VRNPAETAIAVLGIVVSLFASCAPGQKGQSAAVGAYPMVFTDDFGNAVTIKARPQRIVSCSLFTDELLMPIADRNSLLGLTVFSTDESVSNIVDQARGIPFYVGSTLNAEYFISMAPDLVLGAAWNSQEVLKQLKDAGIAVFMVRFPVTLEEIKARIGTLAAVVGEQGRGNDLVHWMEGKLLASRKKLAEKHPAKRLTVLDYNGIYQSASGRGSIFNDMLGQAGLVNAAAGLKEDQWGMVSLSREKILELDPDIIILPDWVYNDPKGPDRLFREFIMDPAFSAMKAVKTNRVYQVPQRHISNGSQYFVMGVEDLVNLAYPDG
jgi:iron complex transport system substrate-binding protein